MTLDEARRWPELLRIVEERVKPERDRGRDDQASAVAAKQRWWQFWAPRTEFFASIARMKRCLATGKVAKHVCFSFVPVDYVYTQNVYIFALEAMTAFSVLQSRLHSTWTRRLSSTYGEIQSYSASDCFETFPFPVPDPKSELPALAVIGQRVYDCRARYMAEEKIGLTITYNRLKDETCNDDRIAELRRLHEDLDREVVGAYGENDPEGDWLSLVVPPFRPINGEEVKRRDVFEAAIMDRLFTLNAKRAQAEKITGLALPGIKKQKKSVVVSIKKSPKPKKSAAQLQLAEPTAETDETEG